MINIAIIPARKNSKRIINKNMIKFDDKPIICNAIKQALNSKIFSKVIVSTDSKKIFKIAKVTGADCPFLRPDDISKDNTATIDVIKHCIEYLRKKNIKIDNVCCIYPVTPFLLSNVLKKSFNYFKKNNNSFLISAHKSPVVIKRAFYLKNKSIKLIKNNNYIKRTQDFDDVYLDAGQFYWGTVKHWVKSDKIIKENTKIFEMPFYKSIDIDNKMDLDIARLIYKGLYK
tara:strand:+ start:2949 stop:3635 length:687 start_codon:yes stop_codon:yes gene_type:complete